MIQVLTYSFFVKLITLLGRHLVFILMLLINFKCDSHFFFVKLIILLVTFILSFTNLLIGGTAFDSDEGLGIS